MNLSDMLSYADISQLSSIAARYDCECNGNSKHELIQSILANVQRKEVIINSIDRLDIVELRFLNFLLFEHYKAYSIEDLLALLQHCRFDRRTEPLEPANGSKLKRAPKKKPKVEATPREMILRFKSNGWLFNGYSSHDRYLFHVPADFKLRYRHMLLMKMQREMSYCEQPECYVDESGLLLKDLHRMLQYIDQHRPNAAADGVLHRRAILQLNEACIIQEDLPGKGAWKFGYGKGFGELPERMTLLYDFLWSQKWIELEGDHIAVSQRKNNAEEFSSQDMNTVIAHWMKRYRTPIPNLRALVYWIIALCSSWCTLDSLQRLLVPNIKPYYFDTADDIFRKRIIKPLKHFGILQWGTHEEYGELLQTTLYGQKIGKELYR